VNRRTFLLAIGAAACGGAPPRKRGRPTTQRPPIHLEAPAAPSTGGDRWGPRSWQDDPSPLHVREERLVQRTTEELRLWDLRAMRRTTTVTTQYRDACFLPDGRIAALRAATGSPSAELHLIDAQGSIEVRTGPAVSVDPDTRIFATGAADALYITQYQLVDVCDLHAGRFQLDSTFEVLVSDLRASLGDGRLITSRGDELTLHDPRISARVATPGWAVVIAPSGVDRAWLAMIGPQDRGAQTLVQARLVDPFTAETRVAVAPAHLFHLACAGDAVAALVDHRDERAVVLIDAHGHERWRVAAPQDGRAFLAMSASRVVMARNDGSLLAWDAATGAPVALAP
jgi:hypothetical protein